MTQLTASTPTGLDGALPYNVVDLVPQRLFDAALWRSVYGPSSTPPSPGPNASPDEAARASEAQQIWNDHGNVAGWLRAHPRGDPGGG
jgi:hypothetical protein